MTDDKQHLCLRCGYSWQGRANRDKTAAERPKACPECKSRLWDKQKKVDAKPEAETGARLATINRW